MQAAGCLIDLVGEFAARMQRRQDDFQRRFVGKFGVSVDGDAASVITNGKGAIGEQLHFDAVGVARHRFVHGIVKNFSRQMMACPFIGAADIHAGAQADGFQPFKDFNILGGIIGAVGFGLLEKIGHKINSLRVK